MQGLPPLIVGEAVTLDLVPARLPSRLLAGMIDLGVAYALYLILSFAVLAAVAGSGSDPASVAALGVIAFVVAFLGYSIGMQVMNQGRTLGKLAVGLRTVRDDGGPVAFRQALTRDLVGLVVEKPGLFLGIPGVLSVLIREDGKRVGDVAAGTMVISDRVSRAGAPPPIMPAPLAPWAATLDLSRVGDDLALRARDVLARSATLGPEVRDGLLHGLILELGQLVGAPPPGAPPWAVVGAVLAERRSRETARLHRLRTSSTRGRRLGTAAYDVETGA